MKRAIVLCSALVWAGLAGPASAQDVDFATQIKPILERSCVGCHGESDPKGGLGLLTKEAAFKGGDSGAAIIAGNADGSPLIQRIILPADDPTRMPAEGDPLSAEEIELLKSWILQNANWPDGVVLTPPAPEGPDPNSEEVAGLPISDAETAAIAAVEAAGGKAMRLAQNTNWLRIDFSLGEVQLTPEVLAQLAAIPNLWELDLGGTAMTDAELPHLAALANLRRLYLERTAVTDAGLANLAGLAKLEYLNLYGTTVTDAGLEHLKSLAGLKKLFLWGSQVTAGGVSNLHAALPSAEINYERELTLPPATAPAEETPAG